MKISSEDFKESTLKTGSGGIGVEHGTGIIT